MTLTADQLLALNDIQTKKVTVPATIPGWGGLEFYIKQLTRGQQDTYLKRQFGQVRLKQQPKRKGQPAGESEMMGGNPYGHDAWLCVKGLCDQAGNPIFQESQIPQIEEKNGAAIGWLAKEILEYSEMTEDAKVASGESTENEALSEEIKN